MFFPDSLDIDQWSVPVSDADQYNILYGSSKEPTRRINIGNRSRTSYCILAKIAIYLDFELFDWPFLWGLPDGRLDPNIHDTFTLLGLKSTSNRLGHRVRTEISKREKTEPALGSNG
jgi:hypothetical protein